MTDWTKPGQDHQQVRIPDVGEEFAVALEFDSEGVHVASGHHYPTIEVASRFTEIIRDGFPGNYLVVRCVVVERHVNPDESEVRP